MQYKGIDPGILNTHDSKGVLEIVKGLFTKEPINPSMKIDPISHQEYKRLVKEANSGFRKDYDGLLKNDFKISNTFHKWKDLRPYQKIGTALSIFGVLSIAGVALYTIAKERAANKKFEEEKEERIRAEEQIKIHEKQHQQQEMAAEEKSVKTPPIVMGDKTKALLERREALPSDMAFPTL